MSPEPALILLRETWSHMSTVSGFDPLCEELARRATNRACSVTVGGEVGRAPVWRAVWRRLCPAPSRPVAPSPFVGERHEVAATSVLAALRQAPDALCLLSAAENQFTSGLATAEPGVKKRLFLCVHQPPSWFRLHWRDFSSFEGVGGLVCLGREQGEFFRQAVPGTPVIGIQHGVSLEFFSPPVAPVRDGAPRLLVVGQWLRDFATLAEALPMVWAVHPDMTVDCVIPREARNEGALMRLARDPRVRWHAGISPEALRDLYRQASLLFLPLVDAVANNAVVEAMACGLPVVTSDVGDIRDYLPSGAGSLCPAGEAAAHARAANEWLGEADRRTTAGRVARAFAEQQLAWAGIADRLLLAIRPAQVSPLP